MRPALLALALGAFGIGCTEFAVLGVLPDIAADLHVSIPRAGYVISGYALGVVVGAPLLTALSGRLPRRRLLLALLALFVLGNLAAAAAPSYGLLMAARVLTALPHGAFFGVGAVVAADLAEPDRRARAIATMFTGLTVANILGVPAATALGDAAGWRWTFVVIAVVGVLALAGIAVLVPAGEGHTVIRPRSELRAFASPQVWIALAVGSVGFAGVFATYSYIAPMMTTLAGATATGVTLTLVLFGVGMTLGNLVGGRMADRAVLPAIRIALAALAAVLALFSLTVHHEIPAMITVLLFGFAAALVIPAVQLRIMDVARGAPTMAAASVQSGFNIANAVGALVGGAVIGAGGGYTGPILAGAVLALLGLAMTLLISRSRPLVEDEPLVGRH